ncbi:swi5-dependent recombination DNA repair protein 1 homolog [Polyodon spathula]|uniref:swi5-dependent recombination DNA repair protein 1 homolog n=1 Tax=Polyodon spathula TaxID=7913 RepID=UPI001B7E6A7A|nr:swi5-dependent recombination DNA repair protein 1 homolog [Polyodon spathula]
METPNSKSGTSFRTPDDTVYSTKRPMSATLKERLKKSRRSFKSPISVVKRLQIDSEADADLELPRASSEPAENPGNDDQMMSDSSLETASLTNKTALDRADRVKDVGQNCHCPRNPAQPLLLEERDRLKKEVREKEETLRRLQMAKMYRAKNDLTELRSLIDKWRSCSQSVLYELQSALSADGSKLSLTHLIDSLGLEGTLLHYDKTEEDFTYT